jgi:IS5 family transposase
MRQQTSVSQASFEKLGRKGQRERFLDQTNQMDQMDQMVPWSELLVLVELHYPKAGSGRQPVGLAIMLPTNFLQPRVLQPRFNLSGPGMEEAFHEVLDSEKKVNQEL